jgi:phage terminase large subunit-like protein
MKLYYQYVNNVLDGSIVTGKNIQLACERFKSDLLRDDLEFREDKVDRAIEFIATLKHFTGNHSSKPFILEPWQTFLIANIIGFY